jgi:ABC-type glycerol-3-phosphate transport system substrate-binding protein
MSTSRRALLGSLALGTVGLGATLAGCNTAPSNSSVNSDSTILWIWPSGFSKELIASVQKSIDGASVRQDIIGGDFAQKLTTTLQSASNLPDITGVKGEDIAYFASHADYFEDLNTLGAKDVQKDYLEWKWLQGQSDDGRQVGLPIDIGPTVMYYRDDVFKDAGLPYDPDEVAAAVRTWDDYFSLGVELKKAKPGTFLVKNASSIFSVVTHQSGKNYIDENDTFIGDQDHIRNAWDTAVKAVELKIDGALASNTTDATAAVADGTFPADVGASWHLNDLMEDAPKTEGNWKICAHPGHPTNDGGSFLTIPKGTEDPSSAFEIMKVLLDAKNQAKEFANGGNFPSTPDSYEMSEVTGGMKFLGGQDGGAVLGAAAEHVKAEYVHALDETINGPFYAELDLVELSGKDPDQAWDAAVATAKKLCKQNGIEVE